MSPNQLNSTWRYGLLLLSTAVLFMFFASYHRQIEAQENHFVFLPVVARPHPYIFQRGQNLLLNPSFEGEGDCQINPPHPEQCWYHPGGTPELQIPIRWVFNWDEQVCDPVESCDNPLTDEPNDYWNRWVRPEVRVLPAQLLPPHEHPLFIWDGTNTLKVFKQYGSINYALTQSVWLTPGKYVMEISVFPDLIEEYDDQGNKIPAPDPLSGEVKFRANNIESGWVLPAFLDKNRYYYVFVIPQAQMTEIAVHLRGRFAIRNNGWFMDDWWLWQQNDLTLPPGVYTENGQPAFLAADYVPPLVPYTFPIGDPALRGNE